MNRASEIEAEVRATINTIVDPCSRAAGLPAGLIDMGLVRSLEVRTEPDGVHVRVVVGVTEYGCMLGPAFATEISRLVRHVRGVASAEVTLDDQFDWVPEDMTESYLHALASRRSDGNAYFLPLRAASCGPVTSDRPTAGAGP
jgi:metal-sulfur cluster biosynthetic enzyme